MNIKQTTLLVIFLLGSIFIGSIVRMPTVSAENTFTTWQTFIKKVCRGSADSAERCASGHAQDLRKECGAQQRNDAYEKCWRKYINNNGGSAGPDSSPFEEETAVSTGTGTSSGGGNPTCEDIETSIIPVTCGNGNSVQDNAIWGILLLVLNIMTAGVALAAVGGFVYAAILYASAENKAAQVVKAKETMFNVVVGLVLFALMYAFLQFIIPGGVFK